MITTRIKRAIGSIAAAALVLSGFSLTFESSAAQAATNTVQVTSIAPGPETNESYLGWHEAYAANAHSFQADGLHFGDGFSSQILNGLVPGGDPGIPTTATDLGALIAGASMTVGSSANVLFQIPVSTTAGWGTLEPAVGNTGAVGFALTDSWQASRQIGTTVLKETPMLLPDLLLALELQNDFRYSGFGVFTGGASAQDPNGGVAAVLSNIVWNDTQYNFAPPTVPPGTTTGDVVAGGILASDPVGTVPTTSNPVVVSITSPVAGTVSIVKGSTSPTLTGYKTLGINSQISAPPSTADQPLKLKFQVYVGDLPSGTYPSDVNVFRDSIAIPACPGASTASPDPCVSDASIAGGVETFTVLSSHASSWDLQAANVGRLAGADRYETALAVSQSDFPSGNAGAVVLAAGENYPDALVAAPLAVDKNAPLLLTAGSSLRRDVKAELQRVLPAGGTVYILGGTSAVPADIASEVTGLGYQVIRYDGADRFATAVQVAGALGNRSTVLLASGTKFPDALSAGVAAAEAGGVVLLTNGTTLPAATSSYITAHGRTVYAVGGPAAAAKSNATRLVGADRYATSVAVAEQFFANPSSVGVASGALYADALSGGALLARAGVPLVLAAPGILPLSVDNYLSSVKGNVTSAHLFGGSDALGVAVQTAAGRALGL